MIQRFARTYAQALLASTDSTEAAQAARTHLGKFADAMAEAPKLVELAASPGVPVDVKQSVVREICETLEIGGAARSTLGLLVENYRLQHLGSVLDAIDELLEKRLGVLRARVTSAQPLDEAQAADLKSVLEKTYGADVRMELAVDESLLAGFIAQIGSYRYDVSLRGQLDRMTSGLVAAD